MSGDYMVLANNTIWTGQTTTIGCYACAVCNGWHAIGCCPCNSNQWTIYPQVGVPYPVPYPVPVPVAPLVNPSAATLVAHAKARLIEVEARLAEFKALEAERDQLRRIVDSAK
jgi:hypothetical protein